MGEVRIEPQPAQLGVDDDDETVDDTTQEEK